jgi:hypothetical protein
MSNRVRLTHRKAADGSVPYPGNVNQPDRKDPAWDQYHTFEQTVNHELPDMRHQWKDDERDAIGFGIPESVKNPGEAPIGGTKGSPITPIANVRVAANKAVKLAMLLLGEKVPEDVIEEQARDFLMLGGEAMDRTLSRFASTTKFYAEEDGDDVDEVVEEPATASKALAESGAEVPPAIKTPADPQVADKAASAKKADEAPAAPAPAPADEKTAPVAAKKAATDMDIELTGAMDDEPEEDAEADAKLAGLFEADGFPPADDEQAEPVAASAKTAKKAGITRLGGQPKVAAEGGEGKVELSSLWATAPDVSEAFK